MVTVTVRIKVAYNTANAKVGGVIYAHGIYSRDLKILP
jgi:hypothetical protein